MTPKLASLVVVVPAYNAKRFLGRAVESIFATGYPGIEVVIVDDGSADDTASIAAQLCQRWDAKCRWVRHADGRNHGVSASRNLGIASSDSEWLAFLDADDFFLPNRFDAFIRRQQADAAFDGLYEICEIRGDAGGIEPAPGTGRSRFGIVVDVCGAAVLRELLNGTCWATSAITLRRSLLERTGLFDPGKAIAEDCDLWFRIAAAGQVVSGSLEQPVSVYWRHADNTYTYRPEHRIAMVRAMLDAWHWALLHQVDGDRLAAFEDSVPAYVERSIIAMREAGHPDIARALLRMMANARKWRFLLSTKTLRQVTGLLRDGVSRTRPANPDKGRRA